MARLTAVLLLLCLAAAGCGSDGDDAGRSADGSARAPKGPSSKALREQLALATAVKAGDFPAAGGRTIQQIADQLGNAGPQLAFATASARTGKAERVAFGVLDGEGGGFVYAPTALYVAKGDEPARGPFPAPADLLVTDPPYRSQTAAAEDDQFAAIYDARVPFAEPGTYRVLAASKVDGRLVGSGGTFEVGPASEDPIPRVGETPPKVATETVADVAGDLEQIDTRVPPSSMHEVSFDDVVGRKPVALIFATPALCQSRVCGPVVDVLEQLKRDYGDRVTFIHQEVFEDNQIDRGLRAPLKAFALPTEPWLFTFGADGKVAARLEGSFGFRAVEDALKAALSS